MSSADDVASDAPLYLDRFKIEKVLGEGSYGKVKLCYDTLSRRMVAVKIIPKESLKKTAHVTRLKREVRIMRLLHHPNITRLYDVIETDTQIVLTMEHVQGGELFDYIVAQKRLKDRMARRLFRQIISALDYCHQSSIIHRDLKPENLLLDKNKDIKIIDFGFVKLFDRHECLQTFCGSPFYASPEMILGKHYQGPEVDVWSMGVILFALLNGHLPFTDANTTELYRKIANGIYETRTSFMSPDSADLIKRMLTVDASARATLAEIRQHRWVMQDHEEPPPSLVPERCDFRLSPPDPAVLAKFPMYGMELASSEKSLLQTEKGPAWGLYHLLVEHEQWEANRAKGGLDGVDGTGGEESATESANLYTATSPLPSPPLSTALQPPAVNLQKKKNVHRLSLGRQGPPRIHVDAPKGPSTPGPTPTENPFDLPVARGSVSRSRPLSMHDENLTLRPESAATGTNGYPSTSLNGIKDMAGLSPPGSTPSSAVPTLLRRRASVNPAPSSRQLSLSRPETLPADSSRPDSPSCTAPRKPSIVDETIVNSAASSPITGRRTSLPRIGMNLSTLPKRLFRRMSIGSSSTGAGTPTTASADTTSTKPLADIVAEIERALAVYNVKTSILSPTRIKGSTPQSTIEIEIRRIKGTEIHALQMRRIKGTSLAYQNLCQELISQLKL
ncbi:hypothetical protein HDU87_001096 [Geranomyces variabilis]|uniref:non-specific serine/threonine protein kinase n=1 Tax=Geranomyces variabilis TaxID=109894 RepID=A0AAD5XS54_9FUNG|nr:hypothetical protein HDU87_001096 [Geranomyces variabilis]